jgi:hypothetical protein
LALSCQTSPRVSLLTLEKGDSRQRLVAITGTDAVDVVAAGDLSTGGPIKSDARVVACRMPLNSPAATDTRRLGGTWASIDIAALERLVAASMTASETRR